MSENIQNPPCPEWEPLIALLAAGEEFDSAEGARLAEHLARCDGVTGMVR